MSGPVHTREMTNSERTLDWARRTDLKMLGYYVPAPVADAFRARCRERGLSPALTMAALVKEWLA